MRSLLLLLALGLRLLPAPAVFSGGRVLFVDMDDYYHYRRILTAIRHFPGLPSFDRYLGYPQGFRCFWPPLHDWLLALAAMLVGLGTPTPHQVQLIAALAPPILGTLTLALFYRLAARDFGRPAGLLALAIAALSPMLIQYSLVGRPDHHCGENLWFLAALLSFRRNALLTGVFLALGLQAWIGSIVFSLVLFAAVMWERPAKDSHLIFLGQVPVLLALTFANHWVSAGQFSFDAPSLFQPVLLGALGFFVMGRRYAAAGAALLIVLAFKSTESFALFSAGAPRLFSEVSEMRPYWSDWSQAARHFGRLPFLLPAAGVIAARKDKLWLSWLGGTGVMMLLQTRYAAHFSLPASLFMACGLRAAWPKKGLARAGVVVSAVWLFTPQLKNAAALWLDRKAVTVEPDLVSACEWIRLNTPATRSLWSEEGRPEYGVYSEASFGDVVAAVAERPAVASLMHTLRTPIVDATLFFFMTDPLKSRAFLAGKGMRYLLLSDIIHNGAYAMYAGLYGTPVPQDSVYLRLWEGRMVPGFRLLHASGRFKVFEVSP